MTGTGGGASAAVFAQLLAALQALAPMPPRALHDNGAHRVRVRTPAAVGAVDWSALERTLTLEGATRAGRVEFQVVEHVDFRPTAAAGLDPGVLALAGRDGSRVRIELWRLEDALDGSGAPTVRVTERRRIWERIDADSLGLLLWNPRPPAGARASLRGLWHQRRALARYDVDAAGWAEETLEAAPNGPQPAGVLQIPQLKGALGLTFQAEHAERGLVAMLQSPLPAGTWSCSGAVPEVSLALLDADRDGRLDGAVSLDRETWDAGDWGQLDLYERLIE